MPFQRDDLRVLTFARDFTLWRYRSPSREVDEGYFDPAHDLLHTGDMILACLGDGPDSRVGIFQVAANAGGAVQLDDLSPVPRGEPVAPPEPDLAGTAGADTRAGRRQITRLAHLAGAKEHHALCLRNADNTARAERAAGEAELDAAAIRWALAKLEPDPERACVEAFFRDLGKASAQAPERSPASGGEGRV